MTKDSQLDIIARLVECGLDEKHATIVMDLATHPPSKASEVGKRIGISRMDAYNTLKKNARYGSHKGEHWTNQCGFWASRSKKSSIC